jgi:hypothetical protein
MLMGMMQMATPLAECQANMAITTTTTTK